jgi:hypothetical protein
VPDRRDTELAQIPPVSRPRNLVVNVVVVERGRILFEPEAAQLFGHIRAIPAGSANGRYGANPVVPTAVPARKAQKLPRVASCIL